MISIIFANLRSNTTSFLQGQASAGGANWTALPPPVLYSPNANIPPNNPWNTVAGRTATANVPIGGTITFTYLVGAGPIPQPTVTITIQTPAGPAGPPPPAPTVAVAVNAAAPLIPPVQVTANISQAGNNYDIALNFR